MVNKDNNTGVINSADEAKYLPLRASKRRASQESSGSNGSSKDAKCMFLYKYSYFAGFH